MQTEQKWIVEILDIFRFTRSNMAWSTKGRQFSVLSFRIRGESKLCYAGKEISVTPEHLLFVPPNIEYTQKSEQEEEIIVVHFHILNFNTKEVHLFPVFSEKIEKIFKTMEKIWQKKEQGYAYQCTSLFYELLFELEKSNPIAEPDVLNPAERIIRDFYFTDLKIGDLASQCFISENYFRRIFQRKYKTSPLKYINSLRIQTAKRLIESEYFSMREIAEKTGFSDQKYFCDVFKKLTGLSPTEYKKSL